MAVILWLPRIRRKKLKLDLKEKRDEEAAILKQLNEQTAKNARRLKQLTDARNEYPVILYMRFELSFTNQVSCRL
jgi:flagellar biosynthesis chaperone FliJ